MVALQQMIPTVYDLGRKRIWHHAMDIPVGADEKLP
jgi:hypothetical protein